MTDIDEKTGPSGDITPRQIIEAFVKTVNKQGYPHPPHIHCNNLGHSGNYITTLETMKTAGDLRAHIAHIQFHSYGGEVGKNPISKAAEIADYVNNHPNITCDVGQVMFGESTIMTADAPLAYVLKGHTKGNGLMQILNVKAAVVFFLSLTKNIFTCIHYNGRLD